MPVVARVESFYSNVKAWKRLDNVLLADILQSNGVIIDEMDQGCRKNAYMQPYHGALQTRMMHGRLMLDRVPAFVKPTKTIAPQV